MNDLVKTALLYQRFGFSVVPIRYGKKSIKGWKEYQKRIMNYSEILYYFRENPAIGIAIVCGQVSGHLEVIDIDAKNDPSNDLFMLFCSRVEEQLPGFITEQAVLATTRNGGFHVFYRSPAAARSLVLARRPATDTERLSDPTDRTRILIETRGNGGYVLVAPSAGYNFFQGELQNIASISKAQRQILLDVARSSNTYEQLQYRRKTPEGIRHSRIGSPLDDYNNRGDVIALLINHGWIVVRETPDKTVFRRPGLTDHDTSGDFHHRLNLFTVFTTSTDFIANKGYNPSAVYAVLECNGDFSLAAKKLLQDGFGIPYRNQVL
jgi:hypothetical protein